jgi:hypothetical protein
VPAPAFTLTKLVQLVAQELAPPKPPLLEAKNCYHGPMKLPVAWPMPLYSEAHKAGGYQNVLRLLSSERPIWLLGGHYGEQFQAAQGRVKALYWYEERVKLQLKTGGYELPAPGVLFDEGRSGW